MIDIRHLTKYYGRKKRGVIDLSLEVKEGEIFGFIGPNGAGKSTTIRTLLNYIFPTSGKATIMGLDMIKDTVEIRKQIGYVPSEVNYYKEMTVKDFLVYSTAFYTRDGQERLTELSERFELELDRKIGDLSFGNKKKLAIVLALSSKPKILFLDEPTSGLDPLMQSVFFEVLEEEKKQGTTIFFSSHVLSEVQKVCDRVGIIKEGQLIKIETIEEILKTRAKNVRIVSEHLKLEPNEMILNLKQRGNTYLFTYTGDIQSLLDMLKDVDVLDLSIVEPTLEEIFMHYYSKEVDSHEIVDA